MKHIWSVFCRDVLEDKTTDVPSLISVTERIGFRGDIPDGLPFYLPFPFPVHIVSNWWRLPSDSVSTCMVRVRFLSPSQTELRSLTYEVDFGSTNKFRSIGRITDLPFSGNGVYEFQIAYQKGDEWIEVASIPLELVHEGPEQQNESTP